MAKTKQTSSDSSVLKVETRRMEDYLHCGSGNKYEVLVTLNGKILTLPADVDQLALLAKLAQDSMVTIIKRKERAFNDFKDAYNRIKELSSLGA